MDQETQIAVFKGKKIRKTLHNKEWWFSVIDVVGVLTDSENPRDYWYKMKIREKDDAGVELSTICRQLKLVAPDGKERETDCADTDGMFRPDSSTYPASGRRIPDASHADLVTDGQSPLAQSKGRNRQWLELRSREQKFRLFRSSRLIISRSPIC